MLKGYAVELEYLGKLDSTGNHMNQKNVKQKFKAISMQSLGKLLHTNSGINYGQKISV
ncbi:hypothetical protein [Vagococcus coleopterorum]|uniref:hypothetical protein n=1 Tax=Vagococcus coleopterorum TaxID=2714946 RepID=UPI001EEBBD0C|nr:hypothetical protein [Vagococcus coleopterorum]